MKFNLLILLIALVASCSGCSDDRLVTPENSSIVTGEVLASHCPWADPPKPYTPDYGYPARVTFSSLSTDQSSSVETDDQSRFQVQLPNGEYEAYVSTPHSRPYRIAFVSVASDTTIELPVTLEFNQSDSIIIYFFSSPEDTLTDAEERAVIRTLNEGTNFILNTESYRRYVWPDYAMGASYVMHEYYIPFAGDLIGWEAMDQLRDYQRLFPAKFPDGMAISLGSSPCPQGQVIELIVRNLFRPERKRESL